MEHFTYIENFAANQGATFERLLAELDWVKREDTPRREYWTNHDGRPYTYGRGRGIRTYAAQPPHDAIDSIRREIAERYLVLLEGCFANSYKDSRDWLGWHADDDAGIDHKRPIAVVTLGHGRPIQFREIIKAETEDSKGEYGAVQAVDLAPGSLLLMHAGCQSTHQHRIPKVGHDVGPRISLTYRGLVDQEERT